jgi:DNA-binding CsgD family transcriptional regulator
MEILRAERVKIEVKGPAGCQLTSEQLVRKLAHCCDQRQMGNGLQALTEYVAAVSYLLSPCDHNNEPGQDYNVTSNWPFDLVRRLGADLIGDMGRQTELARCMSVLQPGFAMLPDDVNLACGISRQFCSMSFHVGVSRYMLMLLCPEDVILSQQRLREVAILAGYLVSLVYNDPFHAERELDLTDREIECLFWIAEGKTSDEIATILGISRNTINNYITSVMRKTATRTRSEAIAFAVRHNLV